MMTQLLQNAVYGTAMILAVALLRRVLKDRLVPGARLALWAACLFRLLTPAAPESVLSLWGLSRLFETRTQPVSPAPAPNATGYVLGVGTPTAPAPQPAPTISWETVLTVVWLAVGAALAVRYVLSWTRTRRAVACAVLLDRDDPRYAFLPKYARLREGPMEGAPLTFGVVRPTVVLLPGLEAAELDCVLAHEAVHAARRDNLWHYAMALALVVHWWNPAVWLMSRLLRQDIELSCDRAALNKLGPDRRADYANALVSLATQRPGPAFCQTFGQKAAEERILSIMKFKKNSVIGIIFTLALVLAVTVAFASEPKEPEPDTVEFHGQTFSRSGLSQATLDWLDWYLSLSEEGQLAVSFVPPELISSEDPTTYDTYADSTTTSSASMTMSIISDADNNLKEFRIDLKHLQESLDAHVADGSMTAVEAARVMTLAEDTATDGILRCAFQPESGLIYDRVNDQTFPVCYKDENGETHRLDPAALISTFVFPSFAESSDYVLDFPSQTINEYEIILPSEVDENGCGTFRDEDGNVILQGFLRYTLDEDGVVHVLGTPVDAAANLPSGTAAPSPAPSAAPAKGFDDYTIVGMDENGYPVDEQGNSLVFDENGTLFMKVKAGYGPCIKEDCPIAEAHYHRDGQIVPISQNNAPTPVFEPDVGTAPMQAPYCPVCTDTRLHLHVDGQTIPLADPCPVDGCTITGNHIHGDVHYSCNGAGHSGGHCDGSCYTYSTPSSTTSSGTHHSESHHGNGHH